MNTIAKSDRTPTLGSLKFVSFVLLIWLLSVAAEAPAQSLNWRQIPGAALDIAVGANGTVWAIGYDAGKTDHSIYRFNGSNFERVPGAAVRIAVDPQGNAWVANAAGDIYRSEGNTFKPVPGKATDIGIGANGAVWVIGNNPMPPNGYGIYRWNGSSFVGAPGAGVRISVDPQGNAWVINSAKNIYRFDGSGYVQMPGTANDIGIGGDGSAFISGTDDAVYKWNGTSAWVKLDGNGLIAIAADGAGNPWGVNAGRNIYAGTNVSLTPPVTIATPKAAFEENRRNAGKNALMHNAFTTYSVRYSIGRNNRGNYFPYATGCLPPNSYTFKDFPIFSENQTFIISYSVMAGPGCDGRELCSSHKNQDMKPDALEYPTMQPNGSPTGHSCHIDWRRHPDPNSVIEDPLYRATYHPNR